MLQEHVWSDEDTYHFPDGGNSLQCFQTAKMWSIIIIHWGLQYSHDHPLGSTDILSFKDVTDFPNNKDGSDTRA